MGLSVENAKLLSTILAVIKKQGIEIKEELTEEILASIEAVKGPQGEKGERGETGLIGEQGPVGPQGIQGEKGDKGDKGDSGDLGPVGPQGIAGDKGDSGPKGEKGEPGIRGPQGFKGDKGERGDKGETGLQGVEGKQGPIGPKGDKGNPGDKGDKGDKGEPGVKGDKGDPGNAGPRGLQGNKGEPGEKGEPGIQGPKGEDGSTPDISPIISDVEKFKAQIRQTVRTGGGNSGGGEVRLEFLDDVDRATAKVNGKFLKYDSASKKFVGADASGGGGGGGDVSNTYLTSTFTPNTTFQLALSNTNSYIATKISNNVSTTLQTRDIIPAITNTYSLGSSTRQWKDLYLSGATIKLGDTTISANSSGTFTDTEQVASREWTQGWGITNTVFQLALSNTNAYIATVEAATGGGGASNGYVTSTFTPNTTFQLALSNTNSYIATKLNSSSYTTADVQAKAALANTNSYIANRLASANVSVTVGAGTITTTLDDASLNDEALVNPAGFLTIDIGGVNYKVPYYS